MAFETSNNELCDFFIISCLLTCFESNKIDVFILNVIKINVAWKWMNKCFPK